MKANALIAGILAISAAGAFANDQFNGEAYYEKPQLRASSVSRSQVKAEFAQAQAAGQIAYGEANYKLPQGVSTKSRAEVLADLEIWRESGLAALELTGDGKYNNTDPRYPAAQAKYEELRSSPRFAARVEQIARGRGKAVDSAS